MELLELTNVFFYCNYNNRYVNRTRLIFYYIQNCWKSSHLFYYKTIHITMISKGYGHIFPRTEEGKIVCILYSLLGVPINGILIASLANFFGQKVSIRLKYRYIHSKIAVLSFYCDIINECNYSFYYFSKLKRFREKRPNMNNTDSQIIQLLLKIVHVIAFLIPGMMIFLLVPSGKQI